MCTYEMEVDGRILSADIAVATLDGAGAFVLKCPDGAQAGNLEGVTDTGDLIGSGRSADIYELGPNRIVRRRRSGQISQAEPLVMALVRLGGFPVPEVHAVDGCDMTMDRIDGVDLITRLSKRPWEARRIGVMLAGLHRQLAAIPVGDSDLRPRFGEPESFIHGDLHPGNVLLTTGGPIVIDWEGAGVGARDADTATTWLLLEIAEADNVPLIIRPLVGLIRRTLLRNFLRGVQRPRTETIAAVCEARLDDKNMRPQELDRIRAFKALHST